MTSLGNHGMCQALSTNTIHGLSTQNVRQINTDRINDISFSETGINLQQVNLDDKYKIHLDTGNFTITQTTQDGTQNQFFRHDKNSGEVTIAGFQGNQKADKTYVDASLNLKADKTYVDASLNLKADKTYVDASLNLHYLRKGTGSNASSTFDYIISRVVLLEDKNLDVRITYNLTQINRLDAVVAGLNTSVGGSYHPLITSGFHSDTKVPIIELNSIYGTGQTFNHTTATRTQAINRGSIGYIANMPNYSAHFGNYACHVHGAGGHVNGAYYIAAHNGVINMYGSIRHNGQTVSSYSDDRLKHNEYPITNALETMRKLQPIRYQQTTNLKGADFTGDLSGEEYWEASGFIAQEVDKINELKYCVKQNTEHNDYYSLNYQNIMIHAVQAIKELDSLIQSLQDRMNQPKI